MYFHWIGRWCRRTILPRLITGRCLPPASRKIAEKWFFIEAALDLNPGIDQSLFPLRELLLFDCGVRVFCVPEVVQCALPQVAVLLPRSKGPVLSPLQQTGCTGCSAVILFNTEGLPWQVILAPPAGSTLKAVAQPALHFLHPWSWVETA